MLTKNKIIELLHLLNEKLKLNNENGEIYIFGGSVMCLIGERDSTYDIDAIFEPKNSIYKYAEEIAREQNIDKNWLNDGVKGFVTPKAELKVYLRLSNLSIKTATNEYLLAMKLLSSRTDNKNEMDDIKFLLKHLKIKSAKEAEKILEKYYPDNLVSAKTHFLLCEIFNS